MFKDLLAITQEKVRCTTTQGLREVEVGQGEEEGADKKLVSPQCGLHPRRDSPRSQSLGQVLGRGGRIASRSRGSHWAKGTSAEKGRRLVRGIWAGYLLHAICRLGRSFFFCSSHPLSQPPCPGPALRSQ